MYGHTYRYTRIHIQSHTYIQIHTDTHTITHMQIHKYLLVHPGQDNCHQSKRQGPPPPPTDLESTGGSRKMEDTGDDARNSCLSGALNKNNRKTLDWCARRGFCTVKGKSLQQFKIPQNWSFSPLTRTKTPLMEKLEGMVKQKSPKLLLSKQLWDERNWIKTDLCYSLCAIEK